LIGLLNFRVKKLNERIGNAYGHFPIPFVSK